MKLKVTEAEFKDMYLRMTYKELQKELGLNSDQVAKIAKQLGLSKPVGRRKTVFEFS